ncbi:hypothetical protein [Vibrio paucivorans]|uniref:Uncharacterized protein n=1 Tax=Vibrio paucivorans TaxID=2829489 RepID=A0A9X3HUI1_9VIBR|nr:hypothetical protein [Vibrio paucivorans]MCW8336613.1 hypothetical protein [Vibrio paucivorans]
MKNSTSFILLAPLLLLNSYSVTAAMIGETFLVSTDIDRTQFYPFSVFLDIERPNLELNYNQQLSRFDDAETILTEGSNIPSEEATLFNYQLHVVRNTSICRSVFNEQEILLADIMSLMVDGEPIEEGEISPPYSFEHIDETGFVYGTNQLLLRSKEIEEDGVSCKGLVVLHTELMI